MIDVFFYNFDYLRDSNGEDFFFEPIAVIEHHGNTSKRGHYTCDVKDYATKDGTELMMITYQRWSLQAKCQSKAM